MRLAGTAGLTDRLRSLLHLDDPPGKIALALAVGVFISCTPFLGLQTILAILVATLFPLNRLATVTGVWLNLPWFAPFVYGAALKVGAVLVPDPYGVRDAWLAYLVERAACRGRTWWPSSRRCRCPCWWGRRWSAGRPGWRPTWWPWGSFRPGARGARPPEGDTRSQFSRAV